MKLTLDRDDLKPDRIMRSCNRIRFEHFGKSVQSAIYYVDRATFYEYNQSNSRAVSPPDDFVPTPAPQPSDALLAAAKELASVVDDLYRDGYVPSADQTKRIHAAITEAEAANER